MIVVRKDTYSCFSDYAKAFDKVKHSKMIECLSENGTNEKDLKVVAKLYCEQTAAVRTENGVTKESQIKKGVRQGCVLSASLFNLYTENIYGEIEEMKVVNVDGVNINDSRYLDDTLLFAENNTDLQGLVTAINDIGKRYGIEMNIAKTKGMVVNSTKKRQHYFDILKAFSSDTHQSIKRRIVTERLTEIYTQMQLHVIGCV